ncbi:ABC transporter substrate-binding protein [Methyloterrigena soli]|uniref:ABC transporter substrate-binding protein n=2 Tax=Paradevosia shaoguanensis TaxID=1335043 RepID=A0AA41UA87_9HYPH|nr:ABC transporter substrate-binding protein [Paradevosia shaoguanensis]MCF1741319.1 ABC transporter substrate-binding protein [Paradevosia shaoguanensis]MCI0125802.1 ABC transporter substrate-binding protein [Paradevosia shaoguanensis]
MATPTLAQDLKPFPDTSRLVAVGGSLTEIIFALGEEDRLVGRDSTAVYPEEALKLPDVGYMRALSPEGVLSVNPSALLVLEGSGPKEALDVLSKASIPYETVPEGFTHEGILAKIKAVGQALGVEDKAKQLAETVDKDLKDAEELTRDVSQRQKVLFILSMQDGKVQASGTGSAANGIIALAGAENAITDYQGYKALTDEAIINAKPDVILMMDRGGELAVSDETLFSHPALSLTPAGQNKRIVRIDGAYLLGFGPRTASAIRDLAKAIYGDSLSGN